MSRRTRSTWMLALVAPLAFVAVACDDDDAPADTTLPDVGTVPTPDAGPDVSLEPGSNLPPAGDTDGTGPEQNEGSTPPLEPVPVP